MAQPPPEVVPVAVPIIGDMKNFLTGPHGRMARWGAGITLAGFLAGGGFAVAAAASGPAAAPAATTSLAASTSNSDLNALLSASATSTRAGKLSPIQRLRRLGGMYGSFTYRTKAAGDRTLAYERGTIKSVAGGDVVVQAADGTTMTWLLESNTVVRDHGKSTVSALADGQLVFVGGPVASGAKDARLIVIRSGSGKAPGSAMS
jgi:hypothetical protein